MIETLSRENLDQYCRKLAELDADLADIYDQHGTPPLWERKEGFATLIHIILEQQVSLASALSAFNKLKEKVGEITPEAVSNLSDEEFKNVYFSRQKTIYARELAKAVSTKTLDLDNLKNLSNAKAKDELKKIKGIGEWTSDIYLLMALLRADVMPKGDLALHIAWKKLKKLGQAPNSEEFQILAERWKPYRAVAARLLWHFYLESRKENGEKRKTGKRKKSESAGDLKSKSA